METMTRMPPQVPLTWLGSCNEQKLSLKSCYDGTNCWPKPAQHTFLKACYLASIPTIEQFAAPDPGGVEMRWAPDIIMVPKTANSIRSW